MNASQAWIKVGPHGSFSPSGTVRSTRESIDEQLAMAAGLHGRLLFHVHGGLVKEADALQIASAMASHYTGATSSLSLIWETGLAETLRDNIERVASTDVFRKALSWVISKVMSHIDGLPGSRGDGSAVGSQSQIETALQSDAGVAVLDEELRLQAQTAPLATAKGLAVELPTEQLLAEDLQYDIQDLIDLIEAGSPGSDSIVRQLPDHEEGSKGTSLALALFLARVIIAVFHRFRAGTHHDPLPTAVEELLRAAYLSEIGTAAWSAMKTKARGMWNPLAHPHPTVGSFLLEKLEKIQQEQPDLTIDLVGHSAGSIVICEMMSAIKDQARKIDIRNVVFLAPAVRLDLASSQLTRFPMSGSFRMYTMCDAAERADKLLSHVYPRSLLFLVSGLLEDNPGLPLLGLARHVTARTSSADGAFDSFRTWLKQADRLVLSPSPDQAAEGLRTRALRHGDFDEDPLTLESLHYLARS